MCNCIEEKNKQLLEAGLYPGASHFNNLSVEVLTGKTFSRMEAVYPVENGARKTHELNLYHSFCPWCGAPYEQKENYKALDKALVKLPLAMAMDCVDMNVMLFEIDFTDGDVNLCQTVRLTYFDKDEEESAPFFSIQAGEDTERRQASEYDITYYFMVQRQEFIKQMQKERK